MSGMHLSFAFECVLEVTANRSADSTKNAVFSIKYFENADGLSRFANERSNAVILCHAARFKKSFRSTILAARKLSNDSANGGETSAVEQAHNDERVSAQSIQIAGGFRSACPGQLAHASNVASNSARILLRV